MAERLRVAGALGGSLETPFSDNACAFSFRGGAFPFNLRVFMEELAVHTITLGIEGQSQGHIALMLLEEAKRDKGFILMESAANIC